MMNRTVYRVSRSEVNADNIWGKILCILPLMMARLLEMVSYIDVVACILIQ